MNEKKYEEILNSLTLEEKASLCSGLTTWLTKPIEKYGVPSVWMSDGPNGLRKEKTTGGTNIMQASEKATCFPTAVTTASSWDEELIYEVGKAIADEAKALRVTTVLGPGINIKRSPLCGRNFEYMSEDPFLTGRLAKAYVDGVQSEGVGVSLKHFCANNQEHLRMSIDSVVDERALREIYLSAFEYVVKNAQPKTVMSSYNKLNGTYAEERRDIITDTLRKDWGFKGIVVSDWGAINDRVEALKAGVDLEMPGNGGINDKKIVAAVKNGTLDEKILDETALRMIKFAFECKENEGVGYEINFRKNHEIARKAAANSAVLLKNNDELLPLDKYSSVAVIGELANTLRYQGAGSSHIAASKIVPFTEAMRKNGRSFAFSKGYTLKGDGYSKKLIEDAVDCAKGKKAVLIFIGLTDAFESEGFDRKHLRIPSSHVALVEEIAKVNENIAVILCGGAPIEMPWESKAKSILNLYLGGQAGGEAAYDLIYGDINPSGKLAETYPFALEDSITSKYFPMGPRTVEYRESIFVGYRYYDKAKKAVQYPFGHGLSYTKFKYTGMRLSKNEISNGEKLTVSFKIKNIGERAGAEVAEVYVFSPDSEIFKAEKELKGFKKVYLEPGEEKRVSISLDERAFSFFNTNTNKWQTESGEYEIAVGASSRDLRLRKTLTINSTDEDEVPSYKESAKAYYNLDSVSSIPDEQFESLLGRKLPFNGEFKKGELTENSALDQIKVSAFGKTVGSIVSVGSKIVAKFAENPEMIIESVKDMPLRSLMGMTGGVFSDISVDGLVDLCNGKKGGLKKLVTGFKDSTLIKRKG